MYVKPNRMTQLHTIKVKERYLAESFIQSDLQTTYSDQQPNPGQTAYKAVTKW